MNAIKETYRKNPLIPHVTRCADSFIMPSIYPIFITLSNSSRIRVDSNRWWTSRVKELIINTLVTKELWQPCHDVTENFLLSQLAFVATETQFIEWYAANRTMADRYLSWNVQTRHGDSNLWVGNGARTGYLQFRATDYNEELCIEHIWEPQTSPGFKMYDPLAPLYMNSLFSRVKE